MFLAPADPLVPSHANFWMAGCQNSGTGTFIFYHKSEQELILMPLAVMKPNQLPPDH
jgi:hypothetical protein